MMVVGVFHFTHEIEITVPNSHGTTIPAVAHYAVLGPAGRPTPVGASDSRGAALPGDTMILSNSTTLLDLTASRRGEIILPDAGCKFAGPCRDRQDADLHLSFFKGSCVYNDPQTESTKNQPNPARPGQKTPNKCSTAAGGTGNQAIYQR